MKTITKVLLGTGVLAGTSAALYAKKHPEKVNEIKDEVHMEIVCYKDKIGNCKKMCKKEIDAYKKEPNIKEVVARLKHQMELQKRKKMLEELGICFEEVYGDEKNEDQGVHPVDSDSNSVESSHIKLPFTPSQWSKMPQNLKKILADQIDMTIELYEALDVHSKELYAQKHNDEMK